MSRETIRVPRIVVTGKAQGFPYVDAEFAVRLNAEGYSVETADFDLVDTNSASVIVITMVSAGELLFDTSRVQALRQFVQEGGSVLVSLGYTGYGDRDAILDNLATFLEPLGCRLCWEQVVDPKHMDQYRWIMSYVFYRTGTLSINHPAVSGCREFWYPGGKHRDEVATYSAWFTEDWDILISGDDTASTSQISGSPPILGVRQYGNGRIAVLTCDPRYSICDGFHPAYGGYVMEKGDGFKLYCSLFGWLSEPSMKSNKLFDFDKWSRSKKSSEWLQCMSEDPSMDPLKGESVEEVPTYVGLIGARTTLSDGSSTVEEYADAARTVGLDFLVFTEVYHKMDEGKWNELSIVCERFSDDSLLLIPGLLIDGPDTGERVVFNLDRWPTKEEVGNSWNLLLFNLNFPTVVVSTPKANMLSPWKLKFYSGLAVFTYHVNKLVDDSTVLYRELVSNDYRLLPVAITKVLSCDMLYNFAGALTCVKTFSLIGVPDALRPVFGSGRGYLSEGPRIDEFCVQHDEMCIFSGGQKLVHDNEFVELGISVSSDYPLKDILVFENMSPIRRFAPEGNTFSDKFLWRKRENAAYHIEVEDQNGNRAISNSIRLFSPIFNYTMCIDKQNSIINFTELNGSKEAIIPSAWITGMDLGAVWSLVPPSYIAPAQEDVTWAAISCFQIAPYFNMNANPYSHVANAVHRRRILSNDEVIVTEDRFDEQSYAAMVRMTMFRPIEFGENIIRISGKVKLKEPVMLKERSESELDVTLLTLMSSTAISGYRNFAAMTGDGKVIRGSFMDGTGEKEFQSVLSKPIPITRGGGVLLWGNRAGNVFVGPADDSRYVVDAGLTTNTLHSFTSGLEPFRNYLRVGLNFDRRSLETDTTLEWDLCFSLDSGQSDEPTWLNRINAITNTSTELCQTFNGLDTYAASEICSMNYCALDAVGYIARVNHRTDVTCCQQIRSNFRIHGFNDTWDIYAFSTDGTVNRVLPNCEGTSYIVHELSGEDAIIAHPLIATDKSVRIAVHVAEPTMLIADIHNPGTKETKLQVSTLEELGFLPVLNKVITLVPGETIRIEVTQ